MDKLDIAKDLLVRLNMPARQQGGTLLFDIACDGKIKK